MKQKDLNDLEIEEWIEKSYYEEKFHVTLKTNYWLMVGTWTFKDKLGVDLRRYNTNYENLMRKGITIEHDKWNKLYQFIYELNQKNMFKHALSDTDKKRYQTKIKLDDVYDLNTDVWFPEGSQDMNNTYLNINLYENKKLQFWREQGVMLRFGQISRFLSECQNNNLSGSIKAEIIKPRILTGGKKVL